MDHALAALFQRMEVVAPAALPGPVSRDPDDDLVIAGAVGGNCDLIITGDRDLLDLKSYGRTVILTPRAFMDAERPSPELPSP